MGGRGDIKWLKPIRLRFDDEVPTDEEFARILNGTMRKAIVEQGFDVGDLKCAVYVIRMTGSYLIAYPKKSGRVLYIGRGQALTRIRNHLRRWLQDIFYVGLDSDIEVRLMLPVRYKLPDYFKNVEADLLEQFYQETGSIPFFNLRREKTLARQVRYTKAQKNRFKISLGIGKGTRPKWAIRPTRANDAYEQYMTGMEVSKARSRTRRTIPGASK